MRWAVALLAVSAFGADFKAGVARVKITPETPIWLSGYASRTHASEGVLTDLWAKALAVEDAKGGRAVIVSTDVIGLPRAISDVVAAECLKRYGLERSQLLLNSSHTHTGPVLRANLAAMYDLSPEDNKRVEDYSRKFTNDLIEVVGAALAALKPARIDCGEGKAAFGTNRRQAIEGAVRIGVNPSGPTDPSVPVLRVTATDGKLLAVLFGYACHNTTLTGEIYKLSGDYAGFAQAAFETAHPGATAMFVQLCGADQNPNPRGTVELAETHGRALAAEVARVIDGKLRPVRGPVRSAFEIVELPLAPHTREMFEKEAQDPNKYKARRARLMLAAYDERRPISKVPYPVQAIRFGKDFTMVALGGEVVVDYALRLKRELGNGEPVAVLGYSNDVMCYIPSARVLKEGGYEAVESMIYYGQPGPFSEDVEETVFSGIHGVLKRTGRR